MILVLKLIMTPILMLSLTLAGRKWGHTVSGLFAGLPLNSGPISFLFALEYGTPFAAQAAVGSMGGMIAVASFAFVYASLARRFAWHICIVCAELAYFSIVVVLNTLALALLPTILITTLALLALLWRMPPHNAGDANIRLGRWDLPARIIVATGFVVGMTALGEILGPQLGGLASTFPIFATVLSVFAHRFQGADAVIEWLRGAIVGMFATVAFYIVIGFGVTALPIPITYAFAIAAALGVNGIGLRVTR